MIILFAFNTLAKRAARTFRYYSFLAGPSYYINDYASLYVPAGLLIQE